MRRVVGWTCAMILISAFVVLLGALLWEIIVNANPAAIALASGLSGGVVISALIAGAVWGLDR